MTINIGRRRFGAAIAALAATAGSVAASRVVTAAGGTHVSVPLPANHSAGRRPALSLIKPPRLERGAVVGLIAPGGVLDDAIIESCVRNLESVGFTVKPGANLRAVRGGYAGTVAQRLEDLHGMFLDREVKAIWTARGGSGCTALLPHIRYQMIRRHPKILIGYSDITALHLALFRHAGLITFHGPVAWSTFSDYSVHNMLRVLMEPQREYTIYMAIQNAEKAATQPQFALRTLRAGVAVGRLIGGNLSIVAALAGTPYAAELRDRLLFLEEVGEPPYRVDRMLTQMDQSQGLARTTGVMMGVFQKAQVPDGDRSLTLTEVLDDHFANLPIPSVYGFSFGHIPQHFTIPVGVRARLDTEARTLTLLESAVAGATG